MPGAAVQAGGATPTARILFPSGPRAVNLVGLSIMWRYLLTEEKHAAFLADVAPYARRAAVTDPLTGRALLPRRSRAVGEATSSFLARRPPRPEVVARHQAAIE
jgi:hypothetical protein